MPHNPNLFQTLIVRLCFKAGGNYWCSLKIIILHREPRPCLKLTISGPCRLACFLEAHALEQNVASQRQILNPKALNPKANPTARANPTVQAKPLNRKGKH